MIGFGALALSALSWQAGSPVRIIPTQEPSMAPLFRLIPSSDRDQAGIVLLQESSISGNAVTDVQKDLSIFSIVSVIRKTSKTSFVSSSTFDLKSFREKLKKDASRDSISSYVLGEELPNSQGNDLFDEMVEGDVVAILSDSSAIVPNISGASYPGFLNLRFGPIKDESFQVSRGNILKLGSPQPGYANIPFQVQVSDVMGLLSPEVGSKVTVDGIQFTVIGQSKIALDAVHPFRVHIRQDGAPGSWTYDFESKWSHGDSIKDSRKEYIEDCKNLVKVHQYSARQSSYSSEFIVDCGQPFQFWKEIEVRRTTKISGYYSHVKIP